MVNESPCCPYRWHCRTGHRTTPRPGWSLCPGRSSESVGINASLTGALSFPRDSDAGVVWMAVVAAAVTSVGSESVHHDRCCHGAHRCHPLRTDPVAVSSLRGSSFVSPSSHRPREGEHVSSPVRIDSALGGLRTGGGVSHLAVIIGLHRSRRRIKGTCTLDHNQADRLRRTWPLQRQCRQPTAR